MTETFSAYRDSISSSLKDWPELSWLNRFLQTPKPARGDETNVRILELEGDHLQASRSENSPHLLSQALEVETRGSQSILLLCHGDSWDVDRDLLDVVCSRFSIDPRFVAKHFDYPNIDWEKHCPKDVREATLKARRAFQKDRNVWSLGGDIMFPLSFGMGSCHFFAYERECLSFAVHQGNHKNTLILFLRAPQSELVKRSRIFFPYPEAQPTNSRLLTIQPSNSLENIFTRDLLEFNLSENRSKNALIARTILPYATILVGCCNARFRRGLTARALPTTGVWLANEILLFNGLQQLITLRDEVEAFMRTFNEDESGVRLSSTSSKWREIHRVLNALTEEGKFHLSLFQAESGKNYSGKMWDLMGAQTAVAKEAKQTSSRVGFLTQLNYVFLPLQLTATAMGMNLSYFGTGNIQLRTFLLMFLTIATLSFVPILLYWTFEPLKERIAQIRAVTKYSRRVGLLFGWFCLFHPHSRNDDVWKSGISRDVDFFRSKGPKREVGTAELVHSRAGISNALGNDLFGFFSGYWQSVLNDIFDTIDKPQWGRKNMEDHTA